MVAPNHWRNPGWRVLAASAAVGCVQLAVTWPLAVWNARVLGGAADWPPWLLWLALATLPAFMPLEEWLFRGVILRRLVRPLGAIAALVISAALFAAVHGWRGIPTRFIVGLILGILYLRTQSLWACITAHTVHNAIAIGWMLQNLPA